MILRVHGLKWYLGTSSRAAGTFNICACFYLCDRVDNVSSEGEQEQVYEELNQQFARKASGLLPLHVPFFIPIIAR